MINRKIEKLKWQQRKLYLQLALEMFKGRRLSEVLNDKLNIVFYLLPILSLMKKKDNTLLL